MTLHCPSAQSLQAFLAGELPSDEDERIAAHLESCSACEQVLSELTDDREVRQLYVAQRGRGSATAGEPSLVDLRERMVALQRMRDEPPAENDSKVRGTSDTFLGLSAAAQGEVRQSSRARLGPYQILRQLGAGAFGVVYLACDERLNRSVALKLPRATVLTDPDLKQRFLREAQALGRLDHPHIVPVFETGEHDGTCFLAIAYCAGPTLDDWLQAQPGPVDPRLAARILLPLAEAAAHAHERQILHRDIKPGNVLFDKAPAVGELDFTPRLTDFGLAKIAEQPAQHTLSGMVLGTPQYMAPEQAAGHLERIGPPTDVYSLGAVLYEILTGQPPIVGNSPVDTLRRVLIDEPPPVRRKRSDVPEDLAAIVMHCLDKSPTRRYQTAAELAADLRRFLAGKPTLARPLGLVERASRWIGRNPATSALSALTLVVAGLALGIYSYDRRLKDSRQEATQALEQTSTLAGKVESSERSLAQQAYVNDIRAAARAVQERDVAQAVTILQKHLPQAEQDDLRGFEWHYLWAQTNHTAFAEIDAGTDVYQLRLADDGQQLAAACKDGKVRLYDPVTFAPRAELETGQGEVNGVGFSPSGKLLASAGDDGSVKVWRLANRALVGSFQATPTHAYNALFLDEDIIVSCGRDPTPKLWSLKSRQFVGSLPGHDDTVEALALSSDRRQLATASRDRTAIVWDAKTRTLLQTFADHRGHLSGAAFSADGKWLATCGIDQLVLLQSTEVSEAKAGGRHLDGVHSLAFIDSDKRLVSGDRSGTIHNWRLAARAPPNQGFDLVLDRPEDSWHAHAGRVWSICALPGGEQFLSAGGDGKIRGWRRGGQPARRQLVPPRSDDQRSDLALSSDGKTLFVNEHFHGISAIEVATGRMEYQLTAPLEGWRAPCLLEDRRRMLAGTVWGKVAVWDLNRRELIQLWSFGSDKPIDDLKYSPAAGLLALTGLGNDYVRLVDPENGTVLEALPAPSNTAAAFSPDGRWLAYDTLNRICLYDLRQRRPVALWPAHTSTVVCLAFSPDGQWLASGSRDRTIKFWTPAGKLVATLEGHRNPVHRVVFSPDGKTLLTSDNEGFILMMDVATGRQLFQLAHLPYYVFDLIAFPGSRCVAAIGNQHEIILFGPTTATP